MEQIQYVDRRGTSCKKWDKQTVMFSKDGLTGLWVADMDFRCPECVLSALRQYVEFGVFGYIYPWDSYYDALMAWEENEHGYKTRQEWYRFAPGVVPAFNWCMNMVTSPGDAVLVLTPAYYPMLEAPLNNDRVLVTSEMVPVNGRYTFDAADFEKKIETNHVKVYLLCSPHNPLGRVWEKSELASMLSICRKHNVLVISDEIHQDITFHGHKHTPSALIGSYDDMLITIIAPSKTFNIAGLQNSALIIPDPKLRALYDKYSAGIRVLYGNTLGYVACEAAFRGGKEWLRQVLDRIDANAGMLRERLSAAVPGVIMPELEGSYLQWIDFSKVLKPEEMADFFENRCGLAMDYGHWFQGNPCCVRMNLATSEEVISGAIDSIIREYKKLK